MHAECSGEKAWVYGRWLRPAGDNDRTLTWEMAADNVPGTNENDAWNREGTV